MGELQKLQYVTVDVFSQDRYAGNQLAIVRVPPSVSLSQSQKQNMAREFNYSETVILHESEESYRKSEWTISIFLTTAEVPLAGHPVVGTACYLGTRLQASGAEGELSGTLNTKAGKVPFKYDTSTKRAEVGIPHSFCLHDRTLNATEAQKFGIAEVIANSLASPAPFVSIIKGLTFCLLELPSLEILDNVEPGLKMPTGDGLAPEHHAGGPVGFFFYVRRGTTADGAVMLRTRMILGSFEDPATGSASSTLAAYLAFYAPESQSGGHSVQNFELTQGVEMGRKSEIGVQVIGSAGKLEELILSGSAVEVMDGSLVIPS